MRLAIVLGAFVGLRLAEACGLRVEDVDFLRTVVYPKVQYPARPLKSNMSKAPVPAFLVEQCSAQITAYGRFPTLLTGEDQGQLSPWAIERAMRKARSEVKGLPAGFRYHDLRHYFASLLIASGGDVKTVQTRLSSRQGILKQQVRAGKTASSRSTSRTRAGSGAAAPRRFPASACSRSRSRSGPR
jgi:integrase